MHGAILVTAAYATATAAVFTWLGLNTVEAILATILLAATSRPG